VCVGFTAKRLEELDEQKLLRVMDLTGIKTRKEAVDYALVQAERAAKLSKLLAKSWTRADLESCSWAISLLSKILSNGPPYPRMRGNGLGRFPIGCAASGVDCFRTSRIPSAIRSSILRFSIAALAFASR
jgi:hypothetical protein